MPARARTERAAVDPSGKPQSLIDDILRVSAPPPIDATSRPSSPHDVVRLERAWLGLKFLTEHADKEKGVVIEAMDAHADNVDAVLREARASHGRLADRSIVVDHAIGFSQRDRDRRRRRAALAEGPRRSARRQRAARGPGAVSRDRQEPGAPPQLDDPRATAFSRGGEGRCAGRASAMNGLLARAPHHGPVRKTFGDARREVRPGARLWRRRRRSHARVCRHGLGALRQAC